MTSVISIKLVQVGLILIGALFQLIAVRTSRKDASVPEGMDHPLPDESAGERGSQAPAISTEALATHFERMLKENPQTPVQNELRAGNLTRTAKVKFVQNFKFRC
jgi:hypothetical protein